jgi:hypothetical protein
LTTPTTTDAIISSDLVFYHDRISLLCGPT